MNNGKTEKSKVFDDIVDKAYISTEAKQFLKVEKGVLHASICRKTSEYPRNW